MSPEAKAEIYAQRFRLAAAENEDADGRHAVEQAFVAGYRSVLWMAVSPAVVT